MKLKRNLAFRKIGDKTYIVDMQNSTLHSINEVGSDILELLKKNKDVDYIIKFLVTKYEVLEDQAREDVENFILELKEKNIIE